MLNRNPVHHSVLSRISVLPKQATTISSEDAVYHSRQQQASPRVTVRLPWTLALDCHCMKNSEKEIYRFKKDVLHFVVNAQGVFKITDCRYCSTKWRTYRTWGEILLIQFQGGNVVFLTKLSSVYDWLEFWLLIYTEIQSINANIQEMNPRITVLSPHKKAANMKA